MSICIDISKLIKFPLYLCICNTLPDIDDHRLAIAKQYGADYAVNVSDCGSALEVAQRVQDVMGDAPDLSFECSGSDVSLAACIHVSYGFIWTFPCGHCSFSNQ